MEAAAKKVMELQAISNASAGASLILKGDVHMVAVFVIKQTIRQSNAQRRGYDVTIAVK